MGSLQRELPDFLFSAIKLCEELDAHLVMHLLHVWGYLDEGGEQEHKAAGAPAAAGYANPYRNFGEDGPVCGKYVGPAKQFPPRIYGMAKDFLCGGRLLQHMHGDDFPAHMALPRIADLIPPTASAGPKSRPAFSAEAYVQSVLHNCADRRSQRRTFHCDGKEMVHSNESSPISASSPKRLCTRSLSRLDENVLSEEGASSEAIGHMIRCFDEIVPFRLRLAYQELVDMEEDSRKKRNFAPLWRSVEGDEMVRSFVCTHMDVKLGILSRSVRRDMQDGTAVVQSDAADLMCCSMNWRYHHLLVKEFVCKLLKERLMNDLGSSDVGNNKCKRLLEREDAEVLSRNVAALIREFSATEKTVQVFIEVEDAGSKFYAYFERDPMVSVFYDFPEGDPMILRLVWAFPSVRLNAANIGVAAGLGAVQAIHHSCSEGEFFDDSCEECEGMEQDDREGEEGRARRCHLGPKWIPMTMQPPEDEGDENNDKEGLDKENCGKKGGAENEGDSIWEDMYLAPIMQVPLLDDWEEEFCRIVCSGVVDVIASKAQPFARWVQVVTRRDRTEDKNAWVCCEFARQRDVPFE